MGTKKTYTCLMCKEIVTRVNTTERFCSAKCMGRYKWETVTRVKILNGIYTSIESLKKYLLETHSKCCECGTSKIWNNKPLTLQVDHIDGNSDNNKLNNLRLLCPNCHTQTPTFGSKISGNRKRKQTNRNVYLRKKKFNENSTNVLIDDSHIEESEISMSKFSNDTIRKIKRIDKPSKETLKELMNTYPMTSIAKVYNIGVTTVRRWVVEYELESEYKPKTHWNENTPR